MKVCTLIGDTIMSSTICIYIGTKAQVNIYLYHYGAYLHIRYDIYLDTIIVSTIRVHTYIQSAIYN